MTENRYFTELQTKVLDYLFESEARVMPKNTQNAKSMRMIMKNIDTKYSRTRVHNAMKNLVASGAIAVHDGSGQGGKKHYFGCAFEDRKELMKHMIWREMWEIKTFAGTEGIVMAMFPKKSELV